MVKLLSLATLFVVAVSAAPGNDWKNYNCPACPEPQKVYVTKYETKYETKYQTKTETQCLCHPAVVLGVLNVREELS